MNDSNEQHNTTNAQDWMYGEQQRKGTNKPSSNKAPLVSHNNNDDVTAMPKEQLLHALLTTAYEEKDVPQNHAKKELRINKLMSAINGDVNTTAQKNKPPRTYIQNSKTQSNNTQDSKSNSLEVDQQHESPHQHQTIPLNIQSAQNSNKQPIKDRWPIIYGLAASLILCLLSLSLIITSAPEAIAEINKTLAALSNASDRHYFVTVKAVKGSPEQPAEAAPIKQNKQRGKKIARRGKPITSGDLYLRENNQFLFIQQADNGVQRLKGSDGIESWKINSKGRLKVDNDPKKIKLPLASKSANLTLMHIEESLATLTNGYQLTIQKKQQLPGTAQRFSVIKAVKQSNTQKGVKEVIIYYDPSTYVIHRIVFERVHLQGEKQRKQVTMDLLSIEPLPDDWFSHTGH